MRRRVTVGETEKKKKPVFWFIYLPVTVLLLAAVGFGLMWLYKWLGDYQKTVPETIVNGLIIDISAGRAAARYLALPEQPDLFGDINQQSESFAKAVNGKKLEYAPAPGTDSKKCFTLTANGEKAATLTLEQTGAPNSLGLTRYELVSIAPVNTVTVVADSGMTVYIDGVLLDKSAIAASLPYDNIGVSADIVGQLPVKSEYKPVAVFGIPEITGADFAGRDAAVRHDMASGKWLLTNAADADKETQLSALAKQICEKYSLYITNDLPWGDLSVFFLKEAPIYDNLRTMEVNWYGHHENVYLEKLETKNYTEYSSTLVSIDAAYDMCVLRDGNIIRFPTDLTLCFTAQDGGGWICCSLTINTQTQPE